MRAINYKAGDKFGVNNIEYIENIEPKISASGRSRRWSLFKCFCGKSFDCLTESVVTGKTKSCGCTRYSSVADKNTVHGGSRTRPYEMWIRIKDRCYNPNNKRYNRYGGRGIDVCEEWLNSFEIFHEWFKSSGYKKGLQIDRIDNDKGYYPDNCRMVTPELNSRNRNPRSNNKTGISGVNRDKKSGKFRVVIGVGSGKKKHIGFYSDFFEACCARKSAENRHWNN